jgi:hypothetical protein
MLYQGKKGNDMFRTTYASYVTRTDMYLKNVQTGSCTKEDLNQESTRGNTRKESDSQKECHIRATEMDDSSDEEEDVAESSQSNEEQVICALMKKLPKEQWINMLINMEQDF